MIEGYNQANTIALETISKLAMECSDDDLLNVATTALTGKGAEGAAEHLSQMIVEALQTVDSDPDYVAMHKINSGGLLDSTILHGIVVRRRVLLDALPSEIIDAKVATINGDLARESKFGVQKSKLKRPSIGSLPRSRRENNRDSREYITRLRCKRVPLHGYSQQRPPPSPHACWMFCGRRIR